MIPIISSLLSFFLFYETDLILLIYFCCVCYTQYNPRKSTGHCLRVDDLFAQSEAYLYVRTHVDQLSADGSREPWPFWI